MYEFWASYLLDGPNGGIFVRSQIGAVAAIGVWVWLKDDKIKITPDYLKSTTPQFGQSYFLVKGKYKRLDASETEEGLEV